MRHVMVDAAGLNVVETGPAGGRAVVFVNSLGTDTRVWDGVVARLPPGLRVVRMDKRGHGLSDEAPPALTVEEHAADLAAVLDALGIASALVVGLSIGGMIAMALADARPDLAARLVLLDTAPRIGTAETWNARIAAVESGGLEAIADPVMERWFSADFRERQPGAVAAWRRLFLRTPVSGYLAACAAVRDGDLSAAAARLSLPVLFGCGSEDLSTPPDLVRAAAALVPGARFVLIDGCGHLPPVERPDVVAGLVLGELAALAPASAADLDRLGESVRRRVLGDAHVDRASANGTAFDAPFQELITRSAWGSVWSRPDLTPRERSIVTVALLAALGHHEELAMHVRATANTGASEADLREALLHVAVYAGVPAANTAIQVAKRILAERTAPGAAR
jgi:3-oxoadipate enol-lactonase/4-carboxymuconolactone decarboxylase